MRNFFGIIILTVLFVTNPSKDVLSDQITDITKLIEFKIKGTSIDVMPENIHVIVDNPDAQIEAFLKEKIISKTNIPYTLRMFGILVQRLISSTLNFGNLCFQDERYFTGSLPLNS